MLTNRQLETQDFKYPTLVQQATSKCQASFGATLRTIIALLMPVKQGSSLRALTERSLSWTIVPRRWNSTSLPAVQEKNVKFAPESPIQRLVTLRTLDQLVTTIARV